MCVSIECVCVSKMELELEPVLTLPNGICLTCYNFVLCNKCAVILHLRTRCVSVFFLILICRQPNVVTGVVRAPVFILPLYFSS